MKKIYIKNMVCARCIMAVESALEKTGIDYELVLLGEAGLKSEPTISQLARLRAELNMIGFDLIEDRKSRVTEKVKNLIVSLVHDRDNQLNINLSDYLAKEIGYEYSYLSSVFSQQESTTIEQYYILQKIERVKELLAYDEMNLNEIADMLNYSSASHLTRQFKKVTGLTPSYFKNIGTMRRSQLDNL